jgi:hypothetical protein
MHEVLKKQFPCEVRDDHTEVGMLRYLTVRHNHTLLLGVIVPKIEAIDGKWTETVKTAHAFAYYDGEFLSEYRHEYDTYEAAQADIEEWFIDFAKLERTA